jgi:hypothetical protein
MSFFDWPIKNKCDQTLGIPKINVLLSLPFGCLHSRALGKGHGVKYGGVYSMEWEAIGKYIKNLRKWETSANKLCKLGGNKLGIIYATHCAHQIAKKYVLPPPHYQPPKMKIIEHFG